MNNINLNAFKSDKIQQIPLGRIKFAYFIEQNTSSIDVLKIAKNLLPGNYVSPDRAC